MMFQQVLLRPEEYSVIATPNLNGDYISDALAAQVGGLGMAPGANIGDECAVFEATHGTAPKYAGLDKVNPGSLILSGAMMFDYMGWKEAADLIRKSLADVIQANIVTYDLARQIAGGKRSEMLGICSGDGEAEADEVIRFYWFGSVLFVLVPTLCVGTQDRTLCVLYITGHGSVHAAFPRKAWERK